MGARGCEPSGADGESTELWAFPRKMWSRGHSLSPVGTCSLRRWPPVPPLCAHPWSSPRREAGGGHLLWSELQKPSGQPCIDGETEAQKGQRLARGRMSGKGPSHGLRLQLITKEWPRVPLGGNKGRGSPVFKVLPSTGARRCRLQPPPSEQALQGLRTQGGTRDMLHPLSVSEKAGRAALLSPPARPGSFTGSRPCLPLNSSPSTSPTETGAWQRGQEGT